MYFIKTYIFDEIYHYISNKNLNYISLRYIFMNYN